MYRFTNDYSEGAHERILAAIARCNREGNFGYSTDPHCKRAAELIKEEAKAPQAEVHFLAGGTQVNLISVCAFLRPHQAIIATRLGHPCLHETGAIEATGHKVIMVPCEEDAKMTPQAILNCPDLQNNEHGVQPKLVYISSTTEMGAVYTEEELQAISDTCRKLGLYLYLDGARLASAFACGGASMEKIAALCDAFTIGGTKNGALYGEALVICNPCLQPDFRYILKQRGGMMAKGFLLGIQFETFFEDGLFYELGRYSTALAGKLREGMERLHVSFLSPSPSNQQFPILPDAVLAELSRDFHWEVIEKVSEDETCIRLVTSWATPEEAVDAWLQALEASLKKHPQFIVSEI